MTIALILFVVLLLLRIPIICFRDDYDCIHICNGQYGINADSAAKALLGMENTDCWQSLSLC